MVRADCRPPNSSTSQGRMASMPGDMVRPVRIMSGSSRAIDAEISEFLQRIITARRLALGEFQLQMVDNIGQYLARMQLLARWREIARANGR